MSASVIIIHHFISLEPLILLGHTPAVQYILACTVEGSKEGRGSTVTLYYYPATAVAVAMLVHLHRGLLPAASLLEAHR